jgi:hypothetical protein
MSLFGHPIWAFEKMLAREGIECRERPKLFSKAMENNPETG